MVTASILASGTAAGAARLTAKQALLAQLTAAKAYDPGTAIRLQPDGVETAALTELVGVAIVRPLGQGRYYLDRERQKEQSAQQGWIALVILLGVASLLASSIALASL